MLGRERLLLHSEEAILHKPSSIGSGRQLDHIYCIAMHMLSSRPISLNMCSHMRRVCLSAPAALIKCPLTQEDQDITLPLTLILVQPNINTEQNRTDQIRQKRDRLEIIYNGSLIPAGRRADPLASPTSANRWYYGLEVTDRR